MEFTMKISLDNAAVIETSEYYQLDQMFHSILTGISNGDISGKLKDTNGVIIGSWNIGGAK